jgi:hypothetical protein
VELVHPIGLQQPHLLRRHHGRDHAPGLDVVLQPLEQPGPSSPGTPAPHMAENFLIWVEIRDRHDARHDRHGDAGRRARSRKRRKMSLSKKYCVIARVAPASILRFRLSRS